MTAGESDSTTTPTTDAPTGPTTEAGTMGATQGATGTSTGEPTTTEVATEATSTGEVTATTGATETTGGSCPAGAVVCEDGVAKTCDGMGGYSGEESCEGACVEPGGCVLCEPGSSVCDGNVSMQCSDDGESFAVNEACDEVQGMACNPDVGKCDGKCALENLQLSYLGCDYYPTITLQHDNYNDGTKIFAAIVANNSGVDATITVTRGAMMVDELVVASGAVKSIPLKWIPELTKGLGPTKRTVDGAYRLRSNQPVTVYQYNLLYADASNDASLLLPVNAWTGDYVVASYPHSAANDYPGFYAIVARDDDTVVTLTPSSTGGKVQAGGGVAADGTGQVTLGAGEVLQVVTAMGGDLTGTKIQATGPIQVIAGHKCAKVTPDVDLCDHLEESMFPVEALALEYIVVPPRQAPIIDINNPQEQGQVVRVIASEADTTLTFTPAQNGVPTTLAKAGDFVEIVKTKAKFMVAADKKIVVAQYMMGQGAGYGEQDPSMLLAVATEQYRKDYLFQAPNTWEANFVDIILKSGTSVSVDGMAVKEGFVKIPETEYSLVHVPLSKDGSGAHTLTASDRVGISVYGIQDFGSYWVVGGLDLDHL